MLPGQAAQHKVAQGTPIVFTMAIPLAEPQPARARALAKASGMQKHVSRNCVSEGLPLRTPLYSGVRNASTCLNQYFPFPLFLLGWQFPVSVLQNLPVVVAGVAEHPLQGAL